MDLGNTEGDATHEAHITAHMLQEVTAKRIPAEALPDNMPQSVKRACTHGTRPDMLLFKPRSRSDPAQYTVVEIKFCRDTDTAGQAQRAASQHTELVDAIKQADQSARVEYLVILVGVSGSIYTDWTLQPLQSLGVSGRHLRNLQFKLHCIAVQQLRWIYCHKQTQERAITGAPPYIASQHRKKRPHSALNSQPGCTRPYKRRKS